jgi:ANTH domain
MERVSEVCRCKHKRCKPFLSGMLYSIAASSTRTHSLCIADTSQGYGPLIREYVFFLLAKLAFHRQHPEFNGK